MAELTSTKYDFSTSKAPMLGQQALVKQALSELSEDLDALEQVMSYSAQGLDKHKQVFVHWLATREISAQAADLAFTQGAQQGIYTCLQILTNENDYVLHEELAYPGFFRAVDACNVKPLPVPLSPEGLDLNILESYCQQFSPKVLYLTANMQNPTNVRYSAQQLADIASLSKKYHFYIIEDDVNYCLPEHWRLPLQQQAPDQVFYVSGLAKYVAGGLRIAYTLVPKQWQQAFNAHIHSQCWMVSTLNIELATRFLNSEQFDNNQQRLADEMRERQALFAAFAEKQALTIRSGGLNVWLELPKQLDVYQLDQLLAAYNIKVRAANVFLYATTGPAPQNSMRLSLGGFNTRADYEQGLAAFDKAFNDFKQQQE